MSLLWWAAHVYNLEEMFNTICENNIIYIYSVNICIKSNRKSINGKMSYQGQKWASLIPKLQKFETISN